MNASSSHFAPPQAIVSPRFCSPNPVGLIFVTKAPWLKSGHAAVRDIEGNLIFRAEDRAGHFHSRKIVFDGSGNPVISMHDKLRSLHGRWQVLTGDGSGLLFSVKRSSAFGDITDLDVFLATNTKEKMADFKVTGSFGNRTFTVHKRSESSMVLVAHMGEEFEAAKSSASEKAFGVTVNPNMDRSFVTALVIILHELNKQEESAEDFVEACKVGQKIVGYFFP